MSARGLLRVGRPGAGRGTRAEALEALPADCGDRGLPVEAEAMGAIGEAEKRIEEARGV